jgi:hypothetical protein
LIQIILIVIKKKRLVKAPPFCSREGYEILLDYPVYYPLARRRVCIVHF